jgi:hypothetical protein
VPSVSRIANKYVQRARKEIPALGNRKRGLVSRETMTAQTTPAN